MVRLGGVPRRPLCPHNGTPGVGPSRHTGDPDVIVYATVFSPRRQMKTAVFKDSFINFRGFFEKNQ